MHKPIGCDISSELQQANLRIAELETEVRALRAELANRAENLSFLLPRFFRKEEIPVFDGAAESAVDLVLTVKNTFDFLVPCIESVFANTDVPFRLFLNDNASTDERVPHFLRKVRDEHPEQVFLFLQQRDLGFTDAANFLLEKTENDVILVNADTVLPPRWASRLLWPIRHSGAKIASCTACTNAGSTAAFPVARQDSELFEGLPLERLDRVFQTARPTIEFVMPCGIGFCMAMSREAIAEVGVFDADTFRPGYGEEVDWCLRAVKAGYANVLVPNLFVYHKHGATMKREPAGERARLMEEHNAVIRKRYPEYTHQVHAFVDSPVRQASMSWLLVAASAEACDGVEAIFTEYAAFSDVLADVFVERRQAMPLLLIGRHPQTGEYLIRFVYRQYDARFFSPNLNWAIKMLYRVKLAKVVVAQPPVLAEKEAFAATLERLSAATGAPVVHG